MAVEIGAIREPRWTRPALLRREAPLRPDLAPWTGDPLRVVLEGEVPVEGVSLEGAAGVYPLIVVSRQFRDGFTHVGCATRPLPEGLYDLFVFRRGAARLISPHAVASVAERDAFTLAHISDLHLLKDVAGALVDQTDRVAALVDRLNRLAPALVICTGDVVSRYGAEKEPLSAEAVEWQARRAQELLLGLRMPLFMVVGNHDQAFGYSRTAWHRYMGRPWDRPTDDYGLDFGGCHLAFVDGYARYDGANRLVERSMTMEQLLWLHQDMRQGREARWRLLFIHYDYGGELTPLLPELGADMLFYGHSDKPIPADLEALGIRNGHLLDREAYRLVRVSPKALRDKAVPWDKLMEGASRRKK